MVKHTIYPIAVYTILNPTAVLICPFIAATTGTKSGFGDFNGNRPLILAQLLSRHYLLLIFKLL
jgi:hypothetical protein